MAVCYIREYQNIAQMHGGVAIGQEPALTNQNVAVGASHAESSPFQSSTRMVRVHVDTISCINIGPPGSTIAVTTAGRMAANQTEYFGVVAGHVLSVIAGT